MLIQKLLAMAQVAGNAVLYILLALSVVSIGIALERWWFFYRRRDDTGKLGRDLLQKLRAGDEPGARKVLAQSPSVEAEVLAAALDWYDKGPDSVQEILAGTLRDRRKKLDGGLLFLGTLGNNAPFIGLFGTVLGIVTAFRELGTTSGGGGQAAMGNVMSAIGEALVATGVGIMVALPAVIFFNVFQKKSLDIEENVASLGNLLVAHMKATPARDPLLEAGEDPRTAGVTGEVEA